MSPRYWPTWAGIGLARLVCLLPLRARWRVGQWLGWVAYRLAGSRRHIVRTNLKLCFPELTEPEREDLVRRNFESSGINLVETSLAWFRPATGYRHLVSVHGLDHLKRAAAEGRGVILLGNHLATLDFCGALLATWQPFTIMYRRNKNPLMEALMTRGRERHFEAGIERDNIRAVIRALRSGAIVWYGPDQDYGRKHSVFAPFFGQPAATITATSRIAAMTGAAVVPFTHYRSLETGRYDIYLGQPLADFPSGDEVQDATRVNELVEAAIRHAPEQYWWVHRRFKTRPPGVPRPYDGVIKN